MKKSYIYEYSLVLTMLLWGAGWSALKILTQALPMDIVLFWRFLIMSLAFLPILYFYKIPFCVEKKAFLYLFASTFLNIAFMVSSFYGMKYGLAGSGSVIITSLSPIMTFLLVQILFKPVMRKGQVFGLVLGLLSGFIILELNDLALFLESANFYFVLCALFWAGVTLLAQKSHAYIHPLHYSFIISLLATSVAFLYARESNISLVFEQDSEFWVALIYLAVFGQTVATTLFFMASGKLGSAKSSSFMFLIPLFALFFAWLILDEPIEIHIVFGGLLSMLGVYYINKKD